jgi:hypothetical protein
LPFLFGPPLPLRLLFGFVCVALWSAWHLSLFRMSVHAFPAARDGGDFLMPWAAVGAPAFFALAVLSGIYADRAGMGWNVLLILALGLTGTIASMCAVGLPFRALSVLKRAASEDPAAQLERGQASAIMPPVATWMFAEEIAKVARRAEIRAPIVS